LQPEERDVVEERDREVAGAAARPPVGVEASAEAVETERLVAGLLDNRSDAIATVTGWIESVARHRAWGFETADDIVQDAILALLRNLRAGKFMDGNLRSYVRRITKNLCVSSYRKMRVRGAQIPISDEIPGGSPGGSRHDAECGSMVRRILEMLDEACREIIVLAYHFGLSRREIADRLGITEGAAKVRLFRCLEKARAM
jgi:RNA polymerase sigma-70 factor (ECF subfamily)